MLTSLRAKSHQPHMYYLKYEEKNMYLLDITFSYMMRSSTLLNQNIKKFGEFLSARDHSFHVASLDLRKTFPLIKALIDKHPEWRETGKEGTSVGIRTRLR